MNLQNFMGIIGGSLINANNDSNIMINKIKTDTRLLDSGDIFVAITGDTYDGHDFIEEAIKKDVSGIVVEKDVLVKTYIPIIKVPSTKQALFALALYMRNLYSNIPLIAITGSVGKTTTKELISLILEKKYRVLKSHSSDNNDIGVPLTMFKLNNNYHVVVMELGMNHLGEIKELSYLCQPNIGVITNIGSSHIGNLGSTKNILKAKLEITSGMNKGILLLNGDDKHLKRVKNIKDTDIIKVTSDEFEVTNIKENLNGLTFDLKKYNKQVVFNLPGIHFISNILLAIKIGLMFEVPMDDIIDAIKNYQALDKRMHVYHLDNNITLIDDCYNASYESIAAGLNIIAGEDRKKIVILGDSLELGKYSKYIHKKIGFKIKKINNLILLAVGKEVKHLSNMRIKEAHFFDNNTYLIKYIMGNNVIKPDDLVYIKGSRRMKLEEIRDYLINHFHNKNLE